MLSLILRLALAVVFAISSVAKLADLTGTRRAVVDFGTPRFAIGALVIGLPLVELATSIALLAASPIGPLAALSLLAVFSLAIAINLARGRRPDCHCFGQSTPIGPWTLVRNAAIAAPAVIVLAGSDPGPSALRWEVIASAVVAVVLWLGARFAVDLLRQHGRLLLRIEQLEAALATAGIAVQPAPRPHVGIPLGEPAPPFVTATGESLPELVARGLPILALFTDPTCPMCVALAPRVEAWQRAERMTVAVLHDRGGATARAYHSKGTPSAVVIDEAGAIASSHAQGAPEIEALVARMIAGDFDPPPGLRIGASLPELVYADLEGAPVALATQLDAAAETLVVFWNPSCGFCRAMRDELRALTAKRAIVIVSTGDVATVRAEGFRAPTLLDPDLERSSKLAVAGTPIGVMIGPDATVRSALVIGAERIFALAAR